MKKLLLAFALLLMAVPSFGANCGGATPCACGDTITSDYTFSDSLDCSATGATGLTISANGIDVDGAGYTLTAASGQTGILYWADASTSTITDLTISGGKIGINLSSADGHEKSGITFSVMTFTGQTEAAIQWFPTSGITCASSVPSLSGITVTGSTFINLASATNGGIHLRAESHASCIPVLSDVTITNNVFTTPPTAQPSLRIFDSNSHDDGDYYWSGIVVQGNTQTGGYGFLAIAGFDGSDYGSNIFSGNTITGTTGAAGGFVFNWSKYIDIYDNTISDGSTTTIDGGGIDIDRGNVNVRVHKNTINNMIGKSEVYNSGAAVMVLDSQNVSVYNNIGKGNKVALYQGDVSSLSVVNVDYIYNTFDGNLDYGIYISSSIDDTDLGELLLRNNIITSDGSGIDISDNSTGSGTLDEDYNVWYNFSTVNNSGANNFTTDPQFVNAPANDYRIKPDSPAEDKGVAVSGVILDFANNVRSDPPEIGAYEISVTYKGVSF